MRQRRVSGLLGLVALAAVTVLALTPPARARTDIQFWHGFTGSHGERLAELVKRFNDSQSEYEVKPVYKGSYPDVFAAVVSASRAKTSPSLAQVFEVGTQTMLLSDAVVPVSRLVTEQGLTLEGADWLEPVRAYYSRDGQLFALPFNASTSILYYNKDVFRKADLDPEKPPATFDEIEAAATRIIGTKAAKCGFSHSWPSSNLVEMMHTWHDQPFADQQNGFAGLATSLLFNDPLEVKVWETVARWQRLGLYTYGGRGRNGDAMFTTGQCAIAVAGTGVIGALTRDAAFAWGTGPAPRVAGYPPGNAIVGGAALWVMKGHTAAEYRGVGRFLEFLGRVDEQAWWHRVTGYLPMSRAAVRRLQAEGWFQAHPDHFTALAEMLGGRNTANTQGIRIGNYQGVRDAIEAELESVLAGQKTPKQGLDDAVRKGNELLQEFATLYR